MSNFSRLHLAALPWRRWRLSCPLPWRGCSVLRTSSSRESLAGQLEPNDPTAGPPLDPAQRGQAAALAPPGLAAGEGRTVSWLLTAQPREPSAGCGGPVPRSPALMCCYQGAAADSASARGARTCAKPGAKRFPALLSFNPPSSPARRPAHAAF